MKVLKIFMHIIVPIILAVSTFVSFGMILLFLQYYIQNYLHLKIDLFLFALSVVFVYILPIVILILGSITSFKLYHKWNNKENSTTNKKAAQNNPTVQTTEEINQKLNQIESLLKDIKDQQE